MWLLKYSEVGQYDHWFELVVTETAEYTVNRGNYTMRPTERGRLSALQMAHLRNLLAGIKQSAHYLPPPAADGFQCILNINLPDRALKLEWWHQPPAEAEALAVLQRYITQLP